MSKVSNPGERRVEILRTPPDSILFLTSHFQNEAEVRAFTDHVLSLRHSSSLFIAIADNSRNLSPIPRKEVFVITPPRNLGYLPGCAHAFEAWLAEHGALPEWVAVTNTDLRLAPDFLLRLETLALPLAASVIAPDILLPGGARQNPLLRERPSARTMQTYARLMQGVAFAAMFELTVRARHMFRAFSPPQKCDTGPASIYAPHGSLVLFRRTFFERGGRLTYAARMYGEEIHIAEQARRAGVGVVWCRDLVAHHFEHSTTSRVPVLLRSEWRAESARLLFNEYFRSEVAA